jgi:exopolysaccharide production protein ExoQ
MKSSPADTRRRIASRRPKAGAESAAQKSLNAALTSRAKRLSGWVRDDAGSLWLAAMIWVAIIYLIVPPEDYTLQARNVLTVTEPNVLFRSLKIALIAASSGIILWRGGLAWLLLQNTNRMFLVCLAMIPLSFFWSIDPNATIARVVTLSFIVFVCYASVLVGWHRERFQNLLRPLLTFLLVASLLFGIFFPDLAIESGEDLSLKDAWRGVAYQKNTFGFLASTCAIFWLHGLLTKETKTWQAVLGILISGLCVVLSRSSSGILATGLTVGFMFMLLYLPGNLRRYTPYIVGTFAILVVVYAIAVLKLVPGLDELLTPIADFFGKDLTFSNRSFIWAIIKEHIQLHPWLGTGYGAFWVGAEPTSPSYVFLDRMGFYPFESHNGYLELVNDLGFLGLLAFFGYLISFIRQSLQVMHVDRNQGVLYLSIFFQQAISDLTESYWLQIGIGFTVFTLATFCIARTFLDTRLRTYFAAGASGRRPAKAADRVR